MMIWPWKPLYRFFTRLSLNPFMYDLVCVIRVLVQWTEVIDLVMRCVRFKESKDIRTKSIIERSELNDGIEKRGREGKRKPFISI